MSCTSGCFDLPCPPPCPPACNCTTNDITYNGSNDLCIGISYNTKLTQVLTELATFTKNRLFNIATTPSIRITQLPTTCNKSVQADVIISADDDNILVQHSNGLYVPTPETTPPADPLVYTVNNGLTESPTQNFKLGGTLTANTAIALGNFNLSLLGASDTGVVITPSTNTTEIHGKFVTDSTAWIKNNTSIGASDATTLFGTLSTAPKLVVGKSGVFTNTPVECTAYDTLDMSTPAVDGYTEIYTGSFNNLAWGMTANQTVRDRTAISGAVSNFQYQSQFRTSGGNLSSHTAIVYFFGAGSVDRIIAYRAKAPIEDVTGFTGTIDEAVAIQLEDQKLYLTTQIATSYGIKQLGAGDSNYFNGAFKLPASNTSIGKATLAAGTVTVATTAAKTGSHIFITRNTPAGTIGDLSIPDASIVNGTSFIINSTSSLDTSTVNWWIINA